MEMKNIHIPDKTFLLTMYGSISCERREPRFLNGTRPVVALASFPGSGNSWTRQILESVTGIYTGSIYPDLKASFEGSKRCHTDGSVFVVKTHLPNASANRSGCKMTTNFTRAILIVRNPYDAMIADYNLVNGEKLGLARKQKFFSEGWRRFVEKSSKQWRAHLLFWLTKFHNPLQVLIYEELQTNAVKETYKVLKFLDFPVDFKALNCLNEDRGQEKYYRAIKPSWLTKDNLYTQEMRTIVNRHISDVYQNIKQSKFSKVIENYLLI